MSAKIRLL